MSKLHPVVFIRVVRIDTFSPVHGSTRQYVVEACRKGMSRIYKNPTLSTRTRINKLALDLPPRDVTNISVPNDI